MSGGERPIDIMCGARSAPACIYHFSGLRKGDAYGLPVYGYGGSDRIDALCGNLPLDKVSYARPMPPTIIVMFGEPDFPIRCAVRTLRPHRRDACATGLMGT